VLLLSVDLAVEAERLGMDEAYFRVHHFARQLSSPFPLFAEVGAKTRKIEISAAVIDMRYENPYYIAENADAADLILGGLLQLAKGALGVSLRIGHIHITVDDAPWHFVDASGETISLAGLTPGPH
jgi:hypothetical protein